jgi:hypothetical protein
VNAALRSDGLYPRRKKNQTKMPGTAKVPINSGPLNTREV